MAPAWWVGLLRSLRPVAGARPHNDPLGGGAPMGSLLKAGLVLAGGADRLQTRPIRSLSQSGNWLQAPRGGGMLQGARWGFLLKLGTYTVKYTRERRGRHSCPSSSRLRGTPREPRVAGSAPGRSPAARWPGSSPPRTPRVSASAARGRLPGCSGKASLLAPARTPGTRSRAISSQDP